MALPFEYDRLGGFEHLILPITFGAPNDDDGINEHSKEIARRTAEIAKETRKSIVLIVGGNCAREKEDGTVTLTEAERMSRFIRDQIGAIPVITDCEPEFHRRFGAIASKNTQQNIENALAVLAANPNIKNLHVVAQSDHLFRTLGILHHQLNQRDLHGIKISFDGVEGNWGKDAQMRLRSRNIFKLWDLIGRIHHLVFGKVNRLEFLRQWFSGKEFSGWEVS